MKDELKKLAEEVDAQHYEEEHLVREIVSSSQKAVADFADLAARVVEAEERPYLSMHLQEMLRDNATVRARLWSDRPRLQNGVHPDKGMQKDIYVAEVFLCPEEHKFSNGIKPDVLLGMLKKRRVNLEEEMRVMGGSYGRDVQICKLGIDPQEVPEMSPLVRIICEAHQQGVPLGEKEPRASRMLYVRYVAGVGRVGRAAELGYMLEKHGSIYVVSSSGEFCIDEHDKIKRALDVAEKTCFACDPGMAIALAKRLVQAGQDVRGRKVVLAGHIGGNCFGDQMRILQAMGAELYAPDADHPVREPEKEQ